MCDVLGNTAEKLGAGCGNEVPSLPRMSLLAVTFPTTSPHPHLPSEMLWCPWSGFGAWLWVHQLHSCPLPLIPVPRSKEVLGAVVSFGMDPITSQHNEHQWGARRILLCVGAEQIHCWEYPVLGNDLLWWHLHGAMKPPEIPPSGTSLRRAADTKGKVSNAAVKQRGALHCPASFEGLDNAYSQWNQERCWEWPFSGS